MIYMNRLSKNRKTRGKKRIAEIRAQLEAVPDNPHISKGSWSDLSEQQKLACSCDWDSAA